MSIEYSLYLKSLDSISDTVSSILEDLNWRFEEEHVNERLNRYIFEDRKAFILSALTHDCIVEILNEERKYEHVLTFRVDKKMLSSPYKNDMLDFFIQLNRKTDVESLLLFNGEEVILSSSGKKRIEIGDSDFWNSNLRSKFEGNIGHL